MTLSTFSAFLAFTCITAFTPGPNNILALSAGIQRGFRGSLPVIGGICTGFLCVMLLCGAVVLSLASLSARFLEILNSVGCAYILWLAWKIATAPATDGAADGKAARQGTGFLAACLLQFANVKIFVYAITACSNFIFPHWSGLTALFAGAFVLTLIGAAGVVTWAFAGSLLQRLFTAHARLVNCAMAVLLLACLYPMLAE